MLLTSEIKTLSIAKRVLRMASNAKKYTRGSFSFRMVTLTWLSLCIQNHSSEEAVVSYVNVYLMLKWQVNTDRKAEQFSIWNRGKPSSEFVMDHMKLHNIT